MEALTTEQQALERAISLAGGKTSLMRALNDRGHDVKSHNTISEWVRNGVPAKYCPDIEAVTGVNCEELLPSVNWAILRSQRRTGERRVGKADRRDGPDRRGIKTEKASAADAENSKPV